jgi:hypothetical protein
MSGKRGRRLGVAVGALAVVAAFTTPPAVAGAATPPARPSGIHVHHGADGEADTTVCSDLVPAGTFHCLARRRTDHQATTARPGSAGASASTTIGNGGGYDPSYLRSAYGVPAAAGVGQTVAVVDAFDDPNAEADLAVYRSRWGLPPCTVADGCLRQVDQAGGSSLPTTDGGWAEEISLDLDMVSAICPNCRILLVEADSARVDDLGTAENTAASLGATVISNSYGGPEYPGELTDEARYFDHPGTAMVASTGDDGYGTEFPAAADTVVAVGGTTLHQHSRNGNRKGTSERVWSGGGSGCSQYVPKPAWQTDAGCPNRTVADVSAVADPATGVWVYDTFGGDTGYEIFGGTSAATPIVASMIALAADPVSGDGVAQLLYADPSRFHDITKGSNGSCSPSYLCTGGNGYDGPSGLGTPAGVDSFVGHLAVAPAAPAAPVLAATPSTTRGISLTWDPPAANGSPITSYDLYRSGASGKEQLLVSIVCDAACSYQDATPRHTKVEFYELVAINAVGPSAPSAEVSARSR